MQSQVLDFRYAVAAISRRWWVVVTLLLLALGGGAVVIATTAPTYRARAQVVLPPSTVDAKGSDLRDAKTEAYIIGSPQVLDPAGKSLTPPVSGQALRTRIHVRSLSSQVEEVAADATSPGEAVRVANAVALAYVASNNSAASGTSNIATSFLTGELTRLNHQIQALDDQIARDAATLQALPPAAAQREAAVIDSLRSQEASLTGQLITIQGRIADAQLSTELTRQGTRLLQPAIPPAHPLRPHPLLILGGAAAAALVLGAVMAIALEQGGRRLRLRDEIAMAAGAPVLASLTVARSPRPRDCREVLERWEPSIADDIALRQAFARLGLDRGDNRAANLVVVTLAEDSAAALLSLHLACYAAARVASTAFIIGAQHPSNASVRAACLAVAAAGDPLRHELVVYGAGANVGADEPGDLGAFDLVITSMVAGSGPLVVPTWDRRTVTTLAASSGLINETRLEDVAGACVRAGMPVAGVFLANPGTADRTTGCGDLPLDVPLALNPGPRATARALPVAPVAAPQASTSGDETGGSGATGNGSSRSRGATAGPPAPRKVRRGNRRD